VDEGDTEKGVSPGMGEERFAPTTYSRTGPRLPPAVNGDGVWMVSCSEWWKGEGIVHMWREWGQPTG
jgi:hypothetical protein